MYYNTINGGHFKRTECRWLLRAMSDHSKVDSTRSLRRQRHVRFNQISD